jgi:hypothetical protein
LWIKKGLIYNVDGLLEWNKSHAQVPVADILEDRLRVYFSSRNSEGKSNISYIEVDKNQPNRILERFESTLLDFGEPGTFDDSGLMPTSIINVGAKKYLYYIGWTTRKTVPYQNAIGLAVSVDEGRTFKKFSEGPIITVNKEEPYFSGTAFVVFDEGIYKMWYLSCIRWDRVDGKLEPSYNIKYAESNDGVNWNQTGKVAIELEKNEGGIVSASVIKENGVYKMWFGKRKRFDYRTNINNTYRIGYAESLDGINWIRKDELAGINVSKNGWDSEMISYPNVVNSGRELLMFYNGNGFGRSGFGYAVWDAIKK